VLAAGRSQRLVSVTGVALRRCSGWGGLSLVERAVRSLLAAGLERVVVVVGYDAGPVATVVGRLAALAAVTATSALSLGLRVAFLRRPLIA